MRRIVSALIMGSLVTAFVGANGQSEAAGKAAVAVPKSLTMYVGAKAGGASDVAARVITTYL